MQEEVVKLLEKSGSIFSDDHFVFTSGKHAPRYIDKMALFAHPIYASEMGKLFAEKYKDAAIDVVVAPAMGGIILSQWTAFHLSQLKNKDILGIYTEKTPDNEQVFTRGYDKYVVGKNVLIVEDNVTTGGSVRKVVEAVKAVGGSVVGVCSMTNINPKPESITDKVIGAKYKALSVLPVVVYEESECPMCKKGMPINTEHGHGKKYLEAKKKNKDIQAIIFDIDHTLLDTEQFIFQAYLHTLKKYKLPSITTQDLRKLMGQSLESTYEKLAPHIDIDKLSETHRSWQAKNLHLAKPFPHTLKTLKEIKDHGLKIAAVTTRSVRNSEETLKTTGIMPHIDVVISKEHVNPDELKPHPRPVLLALEKLKISASKAIMVGDTIYDVEAGKRAGTYTIGVTYGSSGIEIKNSNPDYVIDDIADIISIIFPISKSDGDKK